MGLLEQGSFKKCRFLEMLENLEKLESLEMRPQNVESKGESNHFLEIFSKI